jgi:hypothetical protein
LNTARNELAGCGTQTAGLAFGGSPGASIAATESYDGTSWTNDYKYVNSKTRFSSEQVLNSAALASGGYTTANTAATEEWTWCRFSINKNNNSFLTLYLSI